MSTIGVKRALDATETTDDAPSKKRRLETEEDSKNASVKNEATDVVMEEKEEKREDNTILLQQLAQQVDFYFCDSNLPFDDWLNESLKENDGWLPLTNLMNFNQVARKSNRDLAVVKACIAYCDLVELDGEATRIRRKESAGPVPTKDDVIARSIFAMGFPRKVYRTRIHKFFEEQQVKVNAVWLVQNPIKGKKEFNRRFMGDAYIELESPEVAKDMSQRQFYFGKHEIHTGLRAEYDEMCHKHDDQWEGQVPEFVDDRVLHFKTLPPNTTFRHIKSLLNDVVFHMMRDKAVKNEATEGSTTETKEGEETSTEVASSTTSDLTENPNVSPSKLEKDAETTATESTQAESKSEKPTKRKTKKENRYHSVTEFVKVMENEAWCRINMSATEISDILNQKAINGVPVDVEPASPDVAKQWWAKLTFIPNKMNARNGGRGRGRRRGRDGGGGKFRERGHNGSRGRGRGRGRGKGRGRNQTKGTKRRLEDTTGKDTDASPTKKQRTDEGGKKE